MYEIPSVVMGQDEHDVACFLCCLSVLEEQLFQWFRSLSERVHSPLLKSLLLYIAHDSLKHSAVLRGISSGMPEVDVVMNDCEQRLGEVWREAAALAEELSEHERIERRDLAVLADRLAQFERSLSKAYAFRVRLLILPRMTEDGDAIGNVDLEHLKVLLELIITEKEEHEEIMMTIHELFAEEQATAHDVFTREGKTAKDSPPLVRYHTPDQWFRT